MPLHSENLVEVRLTAIEYVSNDVSQYELRSVSGSKLPEFTAGSHIDLYLPTGSARQYSIASPEDDRLRYILAVKRDEGGRGGSRWLHDSARVGVRFKIGIPRNNFPLAETNALSVFIAGGIGVTPICSMISKLTSQGRPWRLFYAVRSRADAALFSRLTGATPTHLHVDEEHAGRFLDVPAIIAATSADAHLYCCGPSAMLKAFEVACVNKQPTLVHLERFGADISGSADCRSYQVELARSGRTINVEEGQSLLQALRSAGVEVNVSCQQGICGTCETPVLAGIPCHRDSILSDDEKSANTSMMVCCSSSLSSVLVLDL